MDIQRSLLLNWNYFHQEKSMDELRQSLLLTMELEDTRLKAQEELRMRDEQISQLKELLNMAIKERDSAHEKCQKLLLEKLLLQQHSGISSLEDDPRRAMDHGFSSSDCDESIVSSPHQVPPQTEASLELPIAVDRPLPEKGKLLQAVMKAGPLLQTLLLAGPLPEWRHPPPPLDAFQIPPPPVLFQSSIDIVNNCSGRKRSLSSFEENVQYSDNTGASDGTDHSASELKYQRIVLQ